MRWLTGIGGEKPAKMMWEARTMERRKWTWQSYLQETGSYERKQERRQ